MKIYPQDLEDAIRKQPGVRDCVVIGLERDGNADPCAVMLLQDSNDGTCIVENANKSLAEYPRIGHWFAWLEPDFPRTATQKPQLARIREVVEAKTGRHTTVQPTTGNTLTALVAKITGKPISSAFPNDNLE